MPIDNARQIAKQLDDRRVTPRVVRYYAKEGLIDATLPSAPDTLRWIIRLKDAGFSLAEIRVSLPALVDASTSQLRILRTTLERHLVEISELRSKLADRQWEIEDLLSEVVATLKEDI